MGILSHLQKRYCVQYADGYECYREDGFWYSDKGIIVKWAILAAFFLTFTIWFVGGYMHAKSRLRKGLPLLAYHRFLIPRQYRARPPQNHFTFYNQQQQQSQQPAYQQYPYPYSQQPYTQRQDGAAYPEAPPMYNGDAPPGYFAPPGASKVSPNQGVEMGRFDGGLAQGGQQQSGVVGGSSGNASGSGSGNGDLEAQSAVLPPRPPQQAKVGLGKLVDRFRR